MLVKVCVYSSMPIYTGLILMPVHIYTHIIIEVLVNLLCFAMIHVFVFVFFLSF